ncbi:unnamed protein product [Ectocarpus sp. CCAP 1310/34]|nr:unnamed protein product [Ectocarpus sp. CCAP 1310/34]
MRKGNSLYAVNAKVGVATEDIATMAYAIVRAVRDSGKSKMANGYEPLQRCASLL